MSELTTLPLASITESTFNPRRRFDPGKLAELADNIKASGVHQPILVRPLPGARVPDTPKGVTHEIVAGARRYRASQLAGVPTIPAVVRVLDDASALEIALWENIHRQDLTALEEAEGYDALLRATGMTRQALAAKIGLSLSHVHGRLKLLDLCPEGRQALDGGTLDDSRALLVARLPSTELQAKALKKLLQADYQGDTMSYRAAADYVKREFMLRLNDAKFSKADATLVPQAGACKTCPKRTGANPDLFTDVKGADVCTDPPCYRQKEAAHNAAVLQAARQAAEEGGATLIEGREAKALMPHSWDTRVQGHLRLDDAADSPTREPLRKLIGKQMQAQGVAAVLVANPHNPGEIVAVLPAEQVTQLLRAAGQDKAAEQQASDADGDAKHKARKAAEEAKRALEARWRWQVLEAIWPAAQDQFPPFSDGVNTILRLAAADYAGRLNIDKAKALCKLLQLGKVAPKDGVTQWIAGAQSPLAALALMVAHSEVGYAWWRDPGENDAAQGTDGNAALWAVADALGVDRAGIERQARSDARADAMKAKAAEKAAAPQAAKADPPLAPAARRSDTAGAKAQRPAARRGKPAAAPAVPRTSETQAREGIAAALQAQEPDPGGADAPRGDDARPVLRPAASVPTGSAPPALKVGQHVRVLASVKGHGVKRWIGRVGAIVAQFGPEAWDVEVDFGRKGVSAPEKRCFHASELEAA